MRWYLRALRSYAVFSGRARRKEYWFFLLFTLVFTIVMALIDQVLGTYDEGTGIGLLTGLFEVAMIIPGLAVTVRRLHDTNRRGWWLLLALIPIVGGIILFVFMVLPGRKGANRFGLDPISEA